MRAGIVPLSMYPPDQVPPQGFYSQVGVRLDDGSLRCPDGIYSEALNVCNADPAWQQYNRHIILDKYCLQYGTDGMYLDGAGLYDLATQDCKNLDHDLTTAYGPTASSTGSASPGCLKRLIRDALAAKGHPIFVERGKTLAANSRPPVMAFSPKNRTWPREDAQVPGHPVVRGRLHDRWKQQKGEQKGKGNLQLRDLHWPDVRPHGVLAEPNSDLR